MVGKSFPFYLSLGFQYDGRQPRLDGGSTLSSLCQFCEFRATPGKDGSGWNPGQNIEQRGESSIRPGTYVPLFPLISVLGGLSRSRSVDSGERSTLYY